MKSNLQEFKKRICYQIYPASYKDSNNDGYGDIRGIISELDYLKALGIGMIWLSPIYDSPMDDMGYDISDYLTINPLFGNMHDFDDLIFECKKRDILVVMDLVINHTSISHNWFKKAVDGDVHYKDYYFIKKGSNNKTPNNWQSSFSGNAWIKINNTNDYYLHLFCDSQADLNYKNQNVLIEIEKIIKFRLEKGVYGFRCDVINYIYKSSLKNDYSKLLFGRGSKYYKNQSGMFDVLKRIRKDVLDNYETFLVGETGDITLDIGKKLIDERCLDMFFEFEHPKSYQGLLPIFRKKFNPKQFMKYIKKRQIEIPWMANYLENHDQLRSINMYGDINYYKESAKLLATILLTLKGTPFIYQGQEIGMINNPNLSLSVTNDICAHMVFTTGKRILPFVSDKKMENLINNSINRDQARSPYQWNNSLNFGFNKGNDTWIPMHDDSISLENNINDSDSILNYYKELIKLRNEEEVLIVGDIDFIKISKDINIYRRTLKDKQYMILLNFSKKQKKFKLDCNLKQIISNYKERKINNYLPPYYAGIYEILEK